MSAATHYCARCGLPLRQWAKGDGMYWKHSGGWHSRKSCGQRPIPIQRVGWWWHTIHKHSNATVNSGFSEGPEQPRLGRALSGYFHRLTPVYDMVQYQ